MFIPKPFFDIFFSKARPIKAFANKGNRRLYNFLKRHSFPFLYPESMDFEKYDVVFLGYPIWHGSYPMIVNTFIESYDFAGKTVVPFCTHAGSGLGSSVSSLRSHLPNATILNGLAVQGAMAQNDREQTKSRVKEFVKNIKIDS